MAFELTEEQQQLLSEADALQQLQDSAGWKILLAKIKDWKADAGVSVIESKPEQSDSEVREMVRKWQERRELVDLMNRVIVDSLQNKSDLLQALREDPMVVRDVIQFSMEASNGRETDTTD
jgi:hypothetical protein